ncbi:AAA family ATPase [Cellulomonas sp. GbtcB1]|uniref:AAA family ATPase n=1 Tax=Cellulomonas sp. GbtcB1 TaxID=2824746 RepID=UPI001C2F2612|nr:AAA family ATPase [Cellulomonas sp. GbtcB1]
MELNQTGSLWSDRENWDRVAAAIDARARHHGAEGHAGTCVLDDPNTTSTSAALACTRATPSVTTVLGLRMRRRIDDLVTENAVNPLERRTLILEGQATYGKTTATMFEVLRRQRRAIAEKGSLLGPYIHMPWLYVEIGAGYGYKDIAEAIEIHAGLVPRSRDTAQAKVAHLRSMLPKLGVEGIVIDDAHNLRSSPEGKTVDGLKNLLTGLPVTLVFIGLNPMSKSALLNGAARGMGSSVQQIARRADLVRADLGASEADQHKAWQQVTASLVGQFHLPDDDVQATLTDTGLLGDVYDVTQGLFGGTYTLLKAAAVSTIRSSGGTYADAIRKGVATTRTAQRTANGAPVHRANMPKNPADAMRAQDAPRSSKTTQRRKSSAP